MVVGMRSIARMVYEIWDRNVLSHIGDVGIVIGGCTEKQNSNWYLKVPYKVPCPRCGKFYLFIFCAQKSGCALKSLQQSLLVVRRPQLFGGRMLLDR